MYIFTMSVCGDDAILNDRMFHGVNVDCRNQRSRKNINSWMTDTM